MKQLHFRIDESMYQRLTDYANKTRRSIQDCMNEALVNMTESESSAVQEHKFKFIDLFAGIGGMRLAFQNNGGRCVFSSEWDKYCQKTYYANFGEMPVGDIRSVDEKNRP